MFGKTINMTCKNFSKYLGVYIVITLTGINAQVLYSYENGTCSPQLPSFCSCQLLTIECDCKGDSVEFGTAFTEQQIVIKMQNCHRLSVQPKSFFKHQRFEVIFQNISDIRLLKDSFALNVLSEPRMNLTIINSTIHNLPTNGFVGLDSEARVLTGSIGKRNQPDLILNIMNCIIHKIEHNAFGDFKLLDFSISNSELKMVKKHAINNNLAGKFQIINSLISLEENAFIFKETAGHNELSIKDNTFEVIGPAFLLGSIQNDVYIINNTFPMLMDSLFILRVKGQVSLSKNKFYNIPENALNFQVTDRMSIIDNDIKHLEANAFQLITPTDAKTFIFLDGNTIRHHDPMSLCLNDRFNEDFVVIKHNLFQQECSCNITKDIAVSLGFENLAPEQLYQEKIHQQWLQQGECLEEFDGNKRLRIDLFLVRFCYNTQRLTKVLLIVFAVLLILISCCVIIAWRRLKYRGMAASTSSDYQSFSAPAPSSSGQSPWAMVQPDPKTYQETEIHIVFDNAQEMKDLARCSRYSEESTPTRRMKSTETVNHTNDDSAETLKQKGCCTEDFDNEVEDKDSNKNPKMKESENKRQTLTTPD